MATKRKSRKSRTNRLAVLGKPNGVIQPRVQDIGAERFGVVAVDCAKARSKWMLCDFYGQVLVPPTIVEHTQSGLQLAVWKFHQACQEHDIRDHVVAVEMTGTYHRPVQRAFRRAGSETRLVHPFASQHFRVPAHGDVKTDDHDLEAIFRAAVNGFGLLEPVWDDIYQQLQLLARHRRDLVEKRAKVQIQIRQYLERCLPGYGDLFSSDQLWKGPVGMCIARRFGSGEAIREAGIGGIASWLKSEKIRFQSRTVERVAAWSANAAEADPQVAMLTRIWHALHDDWQAKSGQIRQVERELASFVVKTPYVLLLSHPGIGPMSAAELAGEMGPIEHYANARRITGRAGLFPSRYQSDEVDRSGGLSRLRNARLRAAWLRTARGLIRCNAHFRGKSDRWKQQEVDRRDIRCRIANRATRTVFQMVSGRQLYQHRSRLDRQYVLENLWEFHKKHGTPPHEILRDLQHAAAQIPESDHAAEATLFQQKYQQFRKRRRRGPQEIGTILVATLARLGITGLESEEGQSPHALSDAAPDNVDGPKGRSGSPVGP